MSLAESDPVSAPTRPLGPVFGPRPVAAPAAAARLKSRHLALWLGFLVLVLLPTALSGGYLAMIAADQYDATASFAVRSEKPASVSTLLGGIAPLSGTSDTDAAMVAAYLQSPALVDELDRRLGLRAIFSRHSRADPVFGFDPGGSREDLADYWGRMVSVSYDAGTGLIDVQARAFTAQDAQRVAQEAFDAASRMINRLSAIAQNDTTRAAREEVRLATGRLNQSRAALQAFRTRTGFVEPGLDVTSQSGLIGALQQQLASGMVTLGLLQRTTQPDDPRIAEATRRLQVIRDEIAAQRQGVAEGASGQEGYARLMAEYERLMTEQSFAEKTYLAGQSALDAAEAAARSQSYYLAAYQTPMLAQTAEYPRRLLLTGLVALFGFLIWAVLALIYYSLRDRR